MVIAEAIAVLALLWVVLTMVTSTEVRAGDLRQDRVLAYAPSQESGFADPFDAQLALELSGEAEMHPLNDAWMGMNVLTADGAIAGYISDAFVNPDGSIDEFIITPGDADALPYPVYVPARFAALEAEAVRIDMTLITLRAQEPVTEDVADLSAGE